jgi:hypothetical protein
MSDMTQARAVEIIRTLADCHYEAPILSDDIRRVAEIVEQMYPHSWQAAAEPRFACIRCKRTPFRERGGVFFNGEFVCNSCDTLGRVELSIQPVNPD